MTETTVPLLEIRNLNSAYGQSPVLHNVNLSISENTIVSLIGRNGAGKSSTFRSIVGLLPPTSGEIRFDGQNVTALKPHRIARLRIALVPEDRRILRTLTVAENIMIGAGGRRDAVEEALVLFPTLSEHLRKAGDRLSGGEQQMVAIARALVSKPRLLLIDEPLEGLAPLINERIQVALETLRGNLTVLIIEQNLRWLLGIASYHYVMYQGEIVYGGSSHELKNNPDLLDRYIGVQG
jgi:branched-chain amino acid transport system ATP-binding protein